MAAPILTPVCTGLKMEWPGRPGGLVYRHLERAARVDELCRSTGGSVHTSGFVTEKRGHRRDHRLRVSDLGLILKLFLKRFAGLIRKQRSSCPGGYERNSSFVQLLDENAEAEN